MSIPKIVHHVWPGQDVFRDEFHAWRLSWMKHHPDWTFMFWRLDDPCALKLDDWNVNSILHDPQYTAVVKSDILRLYAVLKYGGIYVDTDFECLQPFDDLLEPSTGVFAAREPQAFSGNLSPALIGSEPDRQFIRSYLEMAIQRLFARPGVIDLDFINRRTHLVTGPALMEEVGKTVPIDVHPTEWFYPEEPSLLAKAGVTPDTTVTPQTRARHHWNGTRGPHGWGKAALQGAPLPFGEAPPHPAHVEVEVEEPST